MLTSHFIHQELLDGVSSQSTRHSTKLDLDIFIGGKQWLEMYGSLFALETRAEIKTHYPGLHVLEKMP